MNPAYSSLRVSVDTCGSQGAYADLAHTADDAPRSPRDLIHRFVDHLGPELQAAVFSAFGLFTLEPIYGHVLLNTLRQRPTGPTRDPSLAFEVLDATTLTNEQMLLRLSPERQDTLRRIFAKQQPSSAMETESVTCAVAVLQIVGVEGFLPCPLVMCEVQDQLCAKVGWARRARFCALEKDGDWAGALKRRVALSDLDRTVEVKGAPSKLTPREHARWLEGVREASMNAFGRDADILLPLQCIV